MPAYTFSLPITIEPTPNPDSWSWFDLAYSTLVGVVVAFLYHIFFRS